MNSNEIISRTKNHNLFNFTDNNSISNFRHANSSKVIINLILGKSSYNNS